MSSNAIQSGQVVGKRGPLESSVVVIAEDGETGGRIDSWFTKTDGRFTLGIEDDIQPDDLLYTVRNPLQGGQKEEVIEVSYDESSDPNLRIVAAVSQPNYHGGIEHRGMNEAAQTWAGRMYSHRFANLFPELDIYDRDEELLRYLGGADGPMVQSPDETTETSDIPAGYGIFGQFIDHDITFDPTSDIDARNDPKALRNFRTPRLELDSLYGVNSDVATYLYDQDDDGKLLTGVATKPNASGVSGRPGSDLQRNDQGTAIIGDRRNDENLVISQLHLAFVNFHNRVVDYIDGDDIQDDESRFEAAQRLVRWHFQWVVRHDFLPRICDQYVLEDIEKNGRQHFTPGSSPSMPVEFAGAAYRFGHSLIPEAFHVNEDAGMVTFFPEDVGDTPNLRGGRPIPNNLLIDWSNLLKMDESEPQHTEKITPRLSNSLFHLPFAEDSLAVLNLRRGKALGLPSGQDVSRRMNMEPVRTNDLPSDSPLRQTLNEYGRGADPHAPLWYYVLEEAEVQQDGDRLGGVGSRLVAEVLIGLIEADEASYINAASEDWTPTLPVMTPTEDYELGDIVAFGEEAVPDGLVISEVQPYPEQGDDQLDESVTLMNRGEEPLDITGYTIDFGGGQVDTFDSDDDTVEIDPQERLTVRTGSGNTIDTDYYLNRGRPVLNNAGDMVTVRTESGEVSTRWMYT